MKKLYENKLCSIYNGDCVETMKYLFDNKAVKGLETMQITKKRPERVAFFCGNFKKYLEKVHRIKKILYFCRQKSNALLSCRV